MADINASKLRIGSNDLVLQDAALRASMSAEYSASSTYAVGDIVLKDGQLYECNTAISTAEAWTAAHWTAVTVGEKVADLKDETTSLKEDINESKNALVGVVNDTGTTISLSNLNVYADKKYMNGNGTMVNANAHRVLTADIRIVKKIVIPLNSIPSSTAFAVIKNQSDEVVQAWGTSAAVGSTVDIDLSAYVGLGYTLYINWINANTTPSTYYDSISVSYISATDIVENNSDVLLGAEAYRQINSSTEKVNINNLTYVANGYIKSDGTIGIGNAHRYLSMDASGLRYIRYKSLQQSSLMFVVIKNASNNVIFTAPIGTAGTHEYYLDACEEGSTAYFNQFSYATVPNEFVKEEFDIINYPSPVEENKEAIIDLIHMHRVNKPFAFNGKSAVFCGDSITRGYTSGSTTTENGFPKLFSDAMGMSYTNKGVGGATISVVEGYSSIQTQVQSIDTASDFLFIAGGINDWQLGVPLDTFKSAVESICAWLNANYSGQVIWITPINQGGWETTHSLSTVADIQDYRDIITDVVTIKNVSGNMSIIQGNLFGFPTVSGSAELKTSLFGDLLHPTEHGYVIYSQALRNALC